MLVGFLEKKKQQRASYVKKDDIGSKQGAQLSGTESEFKSEDPGFDPLAGQGEVQFSCLSESTLVQTCLCLTPLRVYGTHPNLCAGLRSHICLS